MRRGYPTVLQNRGLGVRAPPLLPFNWLLFRRFPADFSKPRVTVSVIVGYDN